MTIVRLRRSFALNEILPLDAVLFYILTDATPSTDHILGFFSKVCYPVILATAV